MTASLDTAELYSLLIFDPRSGKFICDNSSGHSALPVAEGHTKERLARALCSQIKTVLGISALLLWVDRKQHPKQAVFEWLFPNERLNEGFSLCSCGNRTDAPTQQFDQDLISRLREGRKDLGRFARPGWMRDLAGLWEFDSILDVEHWNCGVDFCLAKIRTASGSYWFKAVGAPNTQEFANTMAVVELAPDVSPKVVFAHPEWNAWVTTDIPGLSLDEPHSEKDAVAVLRSLADLQTRSITTVPSLRGLGMEDYSTDFVRHSLPLFFRHAADAMAAQVSTKSTPLSAAALMKMQEDCRIMLERYCGLGIADAIVHGDIGHGNVFLTPEGPVFLDWAEAWITHPFVGAEILIASLSDHSSCQGDGMLRAIYAECWRGVCTDPDLSWAQLYSPVLGALVYAFVLWQKSRSSSDPIRHWPLLRSLLREADRRLIVAMGSE